MRSLMTLTVNGERREVAAPVHRTLLEVLREDLALPGTKHGCELGECGTCTVLLDGQPVLSCLALAVECQGAEILTVEGLADGSRLAPAPAGVRGARGRAVRVLHAGDPPDRAGLAGATPRPDRDRDPGCPRREPLPVHGVHEDPRRRRARRRPDGGRPSEPRALPVGSHPERAPLRRRAPAAKGRRLGEGDRRDALRRRPRPSRAWRTRSSSAAQHPHALIRRDRHDARRRSARRLCRHHRAGLPPGPVRDHARDPGRGAALRREGALRRGPRGGRRRRGRGDRGGRRAGDRRRVRAARFAHVDRGRAPRRHPPDPRVRRRRTTSTSWSRSSSATSRKGSGRPTLCREDVFFFEGNTHLPMEQHAAVAQWTPDGKLTLWSSTQTPHYVHRALGKVLGLPMQPRPRHRDAERRRLRRQVRPLQPRDGRGAPRPAHRAGRSRPPSPARRSSTRTAAGTRSSCGSDRACGRTARSSPSTSGPGSTAAHTARTASRPRSTRARSRP